jgi:hypothetical protein
VRTHVADGCGLTGGSGCGGSGARLGIASSTAIHKPAADFDPGVELSAREGPGPGDRGARAAVSWVFGLKHFEHPFGAIGGPSGDQASIRLAERLRRIHLLLRAAPISIFQFRQPTSDQEPSVLTTRVPE